MAIAVGNCGKLIEYLGIDLKILKRIFYRGYLRIFYRIIIYRTVRICARQLQIWKMIVNKFVPKNYLQVLYIIY